MSGGTDFVTRSNERAEGYSSAHFEDVDTSGMTALEKTLIGNGLVTVRSVEPSLKVDLKYSSQDNFLGKDLYGELERCYLQPDVAKKLKLAQLMLRSDHPGYSLMVHDGVRPRRVQREMWNALEGPAEEKDDFLARPSDRSLHNYGAAVDVTIVDQYGDPLDMGTDFDHRGIRAYPSKEDELLEKGELTADQVANRRRLRRVMENAGFNSIPTEWWHFSVCSRREAAKRYTLIE